MNYCFFKPVSMLALASFCLCQPGYSQNKLDSVQTLNEVMVVAQSFQEIIPNKRLTGEQLEKMNSHNVADALRYFSGVQIKDYGGMGGLKTVNVRNMGSQHVGVFYDGIQLGNAQNGTVDLGKFSLDDIASIDLYNGQKSDIFQSAKDFSSGASIYMATKRPRFGSGKRTNVVARYKTGSIQLINPSVRWEQKLSSRLATSLSGEYIQSDGRYKFRYKRLNFDNTVAYDTTAVRQNSDIEAYRIEATLSGQLKEGFLEAKLYYYHSDRGLPGAIIGTANNVEWKNGERLTDKNFFAQTAYTKAFGDRYRLKARAKFAYDYTHYLSRDSVEFMNENVTEKAQADNTYYQQETYLSLVNLYTINTWWDVALATDFQYNKLNATLRGMGTKFSYPQRYTTLVSVASSVKLQNFKAQASIIGSYVHEQVRHNTKSPDKKVVTPALFLGYTIPGIPDLTLRAFAKRIFRMPTFNDLYYAQIGYSNLKPEYTNQYNVGLSHQIDISSNIIKRLHYQADAYYLDVTDKIIAAPTGSQFRWMMTNIGKMEGMGVDMTAGSDLRFGQVEAAITLNYSYSRMRDFSKVNGKKLSSYGDQIPYTPWHSGSAICNAGYKSWGLNYSFIYIGERYNGAFNNIAKNRVPPWYTHDISLQKSFAFKRIKLKSTLEVNNLLDQQYEVVLNYPMPGRNYKLILSIEL